MWTLALKTLTADRGKMLTALVGVIFSVVLVNIQGGLFLGLLTKAKLLVEHGRAQIWVGHRKMHDVESPRDIPRLWVNRIRPIPGVRQAEPYLVGFSQMSLPSGGFEGVVVVGVEPASLLGNAWNVTLGRSDAVRQNDGVLVDEVDRYKLEDPEIGEIREIGGRRARVVGMTRGIVGFVVAPYVFTSYDRAARYLEKDTSACSYILVQLGPEADAERVCATIRQRIPEAEALPKDVYARVAVNFWMTRTGLGISFGAATLLGLLVGLVMVAQTLYAMVLDRLSEFGALKAIGATEMQVRWILIIQASTMAVAGSALGLAVVAVVQRLYSTPTSPILIPWWLSLGSFGLVGVICLVSAILPYLRIRKVDPHVVLQS